MKKKLLSALLFMASTMAFAQENTIDTKTVETKTVEPKSEVKFSGKPIVTIYANYSAGLGHANKESGFNLERSYLGYEFKFLKNLGGKVVFDIGPTKVAGSDLERVAYIKNAMISWNPGKFTLNAGLIGLEQFDIQEKFWGHRYIWKSFQDEYKFNSSADMGVIAKYQFNSWLSGDVTFINGEGYKKINKDNNNRYGAGITIIPTGSLIFRAYFDRYDADGENAKAQQSLALFAGYKHSLFNIGIEYNKLWNSEFVNKHDKTGYSIYSTVFLNKKISVFGRYDDLSSKDHYFKGDERRAIVGFQYEPIRYLRISPNFQTVNPSKGKASLFACLNMEVKF